MKTVSKVIIWSILGVLVVGFAYLFHREMKRVKIAKALEKAMDEVTEVVTTVTEG